jgi:hypothetical protein
MMNTPGLPILTVEEAKKLDSVKTALKEENLAYASQFGRIYELKPVSL